METRSFLLAAQLLLSCGLIAQSWCPPGATWTYRYDGWGADYRTEYRYTNDTIIDGRVAKKVITTTQGTIAGGQPISGSGVEYSAWEEGIIWIHQGAMGWDTLYWMEAEPGDRWWPLWSPMDFPPYGMLEVIDTGSVIIQGVQLRTLEMSYIMEEGLGYPNFAITERIGSNPRIPHVVEGAIDYFFSWFICYSDDEIATGSQPCELTVSLPELSDPDLIKLHPNPGSNFFQLTGLGDRPAQLRMLDLQGRVVLVSQNVTDQQPIDVSGFRSGIYLIEVNNGIAGKQVLRWVKE